MADFLTEQAFFVCDKGGVITCEDGDNKSVTYDDAPLLTTAATVKTKAGICAILTAMAQGVPQPCKCQLTAWIPGFSPTKISSGNPLLIDTAKNPCAIGGLISVQTSGVFGKLTTGTAPDSMTLGAATLLQKVEKLSDAKNPATAKNSANKTVSPKIENPVEKAAENSLAATTLKSPQNSQKLLPKPSKNLFCPYNENDAKCQNCAYPHAPTTVENNSTILKENYDAYILDKNNRDEVDEYYLTVKDKFRFQAHHLISGNQIFAPMAKKSNDVKFNRRAKLVRLANFCGYDINNAKNCIMLVMYGENYGQQGGKTVSAYDTMSLSKIQWHVGGHSYQFSSDEIRRVQNQIRFYRKTGGDFPLLNYVQLVSAELDKLENSLATSIVCRNSPEQKNSVIARLNNLSAKIKKALGAFREKPQRSYPYYVSKEAYLFAFDLPRTAKIILVRRAGENFLFEKFRAERFDEVLTSESGKTLIFNPKESKKFQLDTRADKISCIEFCDNVEYFILADSVEIADIFFLQNNENFTKTIGGKVEDSSKFLGAHSTEILVWLKNMQGEYQYTAIKQKICDRKNLLEAEV